MMSVAQRVADELDVMIACPHKQYRSKLLFCAFARRNTASLPIVFTVHVERPIVFAVHVERLQWTRNHNQGIGESRSLLTAVIGLHCYCCFFAQVLKY